MERGISRGKNKALRNIIFKMSQMMQIGLNFVLNQFLNFWTYDVLF